MSVKEKILILQCVDCTHDEIEALSQQLRELNIPYRFIISNREIKAITKDEFKELLKAFLEVMQNEC